MIQIVRLDMIQFVTNSYHQMNIKRPWIIRYINESIKLYLFIMIHGVTDDAPRAK